MFDVFLMFGLGIIGYLMKQFDFSLAGMVLGIVLGGIAEMCIRDRCMTPVF